MKFYTLGSKNNPVILFFHAMGVVGESSEAVAEALKDKYFIVMPTLSAYCEGQVMQSKQDEINQVVIWMHEHRIDKVELLVASSLGADFAMTFMITSGISVNKVFFDGGQFAQINNFTRKIMVPFLYLAIKSLYWTNGGSLNKILWCDDERIKPYFIKAGKFLDYKSLANMMNGCLLNLPFYQIDEQFQKNIIFEFGSLEDHFKYREAVMKAYPNAQFPIFNEMNHMQFQIRYPNYFANLLKQIIEENEPIFTTQKYSEAELLDICKYE